MSRKLNLMRADRLGYLAGGIALIVWALRRPSLKRTSAAGLGGWLLYQAYTGNNPMFRPLGIRVNPRPRGNPTVSTPPIDRCVNWLM